MATATRSGCSSSGPPRAGDPARDLEDPVYASHQVLPGAGQAVPGYLNKPVYQAAQAVQHSADGYAYIQYQRRRPPSRPTSPATARTAVWCWDSTPLGRPRLGIRGGPGADQGLRAAARLARGPAARDPGGAPACGLGRDRLAGVARGQLLYSD